MNQESIYYCTNCEYRIPDEVEYKAHYRSDFHRYNIRRKVLQMMPVSVDVFQQKFLESQSNTSASSIQQHYFCSTCKKSYYSQGTYNQHISSQKHAQELKLAQLKKQDSIPIKIQQGEQCLFCDYANEEILSHMNSVHGFFIRQLDCLVDQQGLVDCLRSLIKSGQCLNCEQVFSSTEANKQHMIDKGHCFMPAEEFNHLCHFYDFTAKLQALIDEGKQIIEVPDTDDDNSETFQIDNSLITENSEWEYMELTSEQLERKYKLQQQLQQLPSTQAKLLPNGEILLPNGKILGHRMYQKYYDQFHIVTVPEEEQKPQLCIQSIDPLKIVHRQQNQNLNLGIKQNMINRRYMKKRE